MLRRFARFPNIEDLQSMENNVDDVYEKEEKVQEPDMAEIARWETEREEMNAWLTAALGDASRTVGNRAEFLVRAIYDDKKGGSPHDLVGLDCVGDFFDKNIGVLNTLEASPQLQVAYHSLYHGGVIRREMLNEATPRTLSKLIASGVFDKNGNGYDETDIDKHSELLVQLLPRQQGWMDVEDVDEGVVGATASVGKLMLQHLTNIRQDEVLRVVRTMPAFGRTKEVVHLALERLAVLEKDPNNDECCVDEVVALTPERDKDAADAAFWLLVAKAGLVQWTLYPKAAVTDALLDAVAHSREAHNVFQLNEATLQDPQYIKLVAQHSHMFLSYARTRPEWDQYYPLFFKHFPNHYKRLSPETTVRLPVETTVEALRRNPWLICYTPAGPFHRGARTSAHVQEGTRLEYWYHSLGAEYTQAGEGYCQKFHESFPVPPMSKLEPLMLRNCEERDKSVLGVREFQLRFKGLLPELVQHIVEFAWSPDAAFWLRSSRLHQVASSVTKDEIDPASQRLLPEFESLAALAPSRRDLQRIVGKDAQLPKDTTPLRRLLLRYQCRCSTKKHAPTCPLLSPPRPEPAFETPRAVRTGGAALFDDEPVTGGPSFLDLLDAAARPKKRNLEAMLNAPRSASEYFAYYNTVHAVDPALYQGPTLKVCNLRFPANLKIAFQQENPKQSGSKAHERYDAYKVATTLAQFNALSGGRWSALTYDFEHGFVVLG